MTDIIILFCTSLLGFIVGQAWENHQIRKERLYSDLYQFVVKFRANIKLNKVVLFDFLNEFNLSASNDFVLCSNSILVKKSCNCRLVKSNELNYICKFFNGLNAQNHKELLDHLDFFCDYFSSMLSQVRSDNKHKARLGQKLGLLCGVIVGLVLI